jgi:hypothetical protein
LDLVELLKPDVRKVVLALLLPVAIYTLVTFRPGGVLDFYWYLLTPRMGYWDGTSMTYVFNRYVLLWIPIYLLSCGIVHLASAYKRTS